MAEIDYKKVGTPTAMSMFNVKIAKVAQGFAKKNMPFDEPCARFDFRDKVDAAEKESERINGFVRDDIKVEVGDLEKYGDPELFELVEDQEDTQYKFVEGVRSSITSGHTLSYKCKKRGHGIAVFIPIEKYKEMNETKKKVKKE